MFLTSGSSSTLHLLQSYEYQITEKVKVLVTLKIAEAMEEERYSALYVKIEAVISKVCVE